MSFCINVLYYNTLIVIVYNFADIIVVYLKITKFKWTKIWINYTGVVVFIVDKRFLLLLYILITYSTES